MELSKRNLSPNGKKSELIRRLRNFVPSDSRNVTMSGSTLNDFEESVRVKDEVETDETPKGKQRKMVTSNKTKVNSISQPVQKQVTPPRNVQLKSVLKGTTRSDYRIKQYNPDDKRYAKLVELNTRRNITEPPKLVYNKSPMEMPLKPLRKELLKRGLSTVGLKYQLARRLTLAIANEEVRDPSSIFETTKIGIGKTTNKRKLNQGDDVVEKRGEDVEGVDCCDENDLEVNYKFYNYVPCEILTFITPGSREDEKKIGMSGKCKKEGESGKGVANDGIRGGGVGMDLNSDCVHGNRNVDLMVIVVVVVAVVVVVVVVVLMLILTLRVL
eukprot:TRINITY_DN2595_c1_g1_i12.p1 TRINITY_DN2595_c1_g1~~TRINITY_DN2595_c1_g1_i12.p1  ORF type:complete len:328 (-),score=81.06 TRINITY_DN2595_c1_g1_i12:659-1642(-)